MFRVGCVLSRLGRDDKPPVEDLALADDSASPVCLWHSLSERSCACAIGSITLRRRSEKRPLRRSGTIVSQAEINAETQYAGLRHEPDPARATELAELGLLGRLAAQACLIEVYSDAPSPSDFRACLAKHLAFWRQRVRDTKRSAQQQLPEDAVAPFLWIITTGKPTALLTTLKPEAAPDDWPLGVSLFCGDVLRVGIIVASELPRDPTTLLVRIMAAGPLLAPAVKEVAALPATAPARVIAEPLLLQLQRILGQVPNPDPNEQEFIMAMIKSWEESRAEARQEGRQEGHQEVLLRVLRLRFGGEVDVRVEQRVAAASVEQVETWTACLLSAPTLAELLAD
ncbi:MAG TPA: DUF4351 domain-containing protein [Kofleriaceae bacterium]|nr:DUF4351 domain-containing protein [Kofleriaceae bacterium]